jgi:hypothetical protein
MSYEDSMFEEWPRAMPLFLIVAFFGVITGTAVFLVKH